MTPAEALDGAEGQETVGGEAGVQSEPFSVVGFRVGFLSVAAGVCRGCELVHKTLEVDEEFSHGAFPERQDEEDEVPAQCEEEVGKAGEHPVMKLPFWIIQFLYVTYS